MYLIRIGELSLKGKNIRFFETTLKQNLTSGRRGWVIRGRAGRFFLFTPEEDQTEAETRLSRTFGIKGFARAFREEKNLPALRERAADLYSEKAVQGPVSFRLSPRRTDKSFPLSSYELACDLADYILTEYPGSRVDLHTPELEIHVEIRHEGAYLYGEDKPGLGGLPVGTAGKGLLLLSGGIDSPVAGYLMAKRGLAVSAVYFHSWPYTSEDALEKVKRLGELLSPFLGGIKLHIVNITPLQQRIAERAREPEYTLLLRGCMTRIASILASSLGAGCLITGESLSQVASQTLESLATTNQFSPLPIFRPLIGMDKEEIMDLARKIGTYETSILPYPDCCSVFAPEHPLIHPVPLAVMESFDRLEAENLLNEAAASAEQVIFRQG